MNNQIKEEGLTDAYLLGKYDGIKQGKADAEREFQNSDYWNDYLAKVIADAKAEAIEEFVRAINSRLLRFVPTDYDDILFIAEQLKEQKND